MNLLALEAKTTLVVALLALAPHDAQRGWIEQCCCKWRASYHIGSQNEHLCVPDHKILALIGVVTGYWLLRVCLRTSSHCSAGVCDVDIVPDNFFASSAGFELKLKVSSFCN
jgi:hypothetical protein